MKQTTVNDCKIIDIRRYSDTRGYLSVVENGIDIPFEIKRIYYLYMVPEVARGAHGRRRFLRQRALGADRAGRQRQDRAGRQGRCGDGAEGKDRGAGR